MATNLNASSIRRGDNREMRVSSSRKMRSSVCARVLISKCIRNPGERSMVLIKRVSPPPGASSPVLVRYPLLCVHFLNKKNNAGACRGSAAKRGSQTREKEKNTRAYRLECRLYGINMRRLCPGVTFAYFHPLTHIVRGERASERNGTLLDRVPANPVSPNFTSQ